MFTAALFFFIKLRPFGLIYAEVLILSLKSDFALSSWVLSPGNTCICYTSAYSRHNAYWIGVSNIELQWQCESEAVEQARSNTRRWHCTVLGIQSVWRRELPAHAQSDLWPFLKQNVITTDMSSTLCATASLSFLPALSCCPSSVVLEKHQQQITPAEPSSLSSSAAYLPNSPCKGDSKPNTTVAVWI